MLSRPSDLARLLGRLPHGPRDLPAQLGVWLLFGLAYEAVRGAVGHDQARAFADARTLIALERGLHAFFEASLQRGLVAGSTLGEAFAASYWLSEFALLVVALAYTYFRRREIYSHFRNAVLIANGFGLVGYLAFPVAPPRLFPAEGFRNSLSGQPLPTHPTGLIGFAGNPYAAMPSLHISDAILVAVFLAGVSSSRVAKAGWFLWPCWLAYVVLATGNHFWLDVAAGAGVAAAGLALSAWLRPIAGLGIATGKLLLRAASRESVGSGRSARPDGRAGIAGGVQQSSAQQRGDVRCGRARDDSPSGSGRKNRRNPRFLRAPAEARFSRRRRLV